MSIFEKIKQFFKNIGNKQKLLECPKEIREEMSDMVSSHKKESKFLEDIKFDPKDLLDPRVCQGDNFVPNILRTLGANEDVIKNPQAIDAIEKQFRGIARQSGLKMPNRFEQPTREQVEAIVEAVKSNMVLSSEERNEKYRTRSLKTPLKVYNGLSIDKETGSVTIGKLSIAGKEMTAGMSFDNYDNYRESTFTPDGKGNVISTGSYSRVSDNNIEMLSGDSRTILNSDGIAMESERKLYKQVDGEDKVKYHSIAKRDAEYPFIAQEEVLVDDYFLDKYTGTRYMAINMKDLAQLDAPEYQKDENGRTTFTKITFDDRAQISKYYQDNKEAIDNALMQEPDHGLFPSLNQSLKAGIKKLAIKAGILPNEHEQETEIAE